MTTERGNVIANSSKEELERAGYTHSAATKVAQTNDPTVYHVGAGDARYVFVPGIVKPLNVGNIERAAFICRACNEYDADKALLDEMLATLYRAESTLSALAGVGVPETLEQIRAAIARAEE